MARGSWTCYESPVIGKDSQVLSERLIILKGMENACIIYEDLDKLQLGACIFHEWINAETLEIDQEAVAEWVHSVVVQTNTVYTERTSFVGEKEIVVTGSYGYQIDEQKETERILVDIRTGGITVRTPIYSQQAASRGNELGNTFVEVICHG